MNSVWKIGGRSEIKWILPKQLNWRRQFLSKIYKYRKLVWSLYESTWRAAAPDHTRHTTAHYSTQRQPIDTDLTRVRSNWRRRTSSDSNGCAAWQLRTTYYSAFRVPHTIHNEDRPPDNIFYTTYRTHWELDNFKYNNPTINNA